MKKIFVFILWFPISCFSLEVSDAIPSDFGKTPRTEVQKEALRTITSVLKKQDIELKLSLAYTNFSTGDIWFRLYSDMSIHIVDVEKFEYINSVTIKPYSELVIEDIFANNSDFNDLVLKAKPGYRVASEVNRFGCTQDNPMKYADINADGINEVLLFVGSTERYETAESNYIDFNIFSSTKYKSIFRAILAREDQSETKKWVDMLDEYKPLSDKEKNRVPYKVKSSAATDRGGISIQPAILGYAKLYFSDFNEDELHDIVVWRKLYESRLISDPIEGFELKGNLFVHYSLIEGEYKLQETEQEEIQGWLTAGELSWQKGYPSKSECDGEEGQLIPEMHDALLNDPDVLH